MKEVTSPEEAVKSEEISATLEEDRRLYMEAVIVRIMKSRKTLAHNELIAEITKQASIRFSPSPQVTLFKAIYNNFI